MFPCPARGKKRSVSIDREGWVYRTWGCLERWSLQFSLFFSTSLAFIAKCCVSLLSPYLSDVSKQVWNVESDLQAISNPYREQSREESTAPAKSEQMFVEQSGRFRSSLILENLQGWSHLQAFSFLNGSWSWDIGTNALVLGRLNKEKHK